jgi:two-component system, cell cycle sensor histidine kinase and response regulator CckA
LRVDSSSLTASPSLEPLRRFVTLREPSVPAQYVLSAIWVAAAAMVRSYLAPVLDHSAPLLVMIVPAVLAALFGRFGPAVLATALSTVAGVYLFVEPAGAFGPLQPGDRARVIVFVVESVILAGLVVLTRQARLQGADASQTAAHAHRLLETTLASVPHAIVVVNASGRVRMWSGAAEQIFGWTAAEMAGQPYERLVPETGLQEFRRFFDRALSGESIRLTAPRLRKNGSTLHCDVFVAPVREPDGRISGMVGTLVDVTEQRAMEDQLRQAQKMEAVGALAAGVAHDFNNQLTAIIGYTQLVQATIPAGDPAQADLEEVSKAAERSAALTRKLLSFTRRQLLQLEPVELTAAVTGVQAMLRRLVREDVVIETRTGSEPLWITADPAQLEHMILNLVLNARDAMPRGGRVLIEVAPAQVDEPYADTHFQIAPGSYATLSVSDTGEGMPPEVQQRIFEPFFTTKGEGKGTGLGLAMVHTSVKMMGGSVWVHSEPGRGTTFKLYLRRTDDSGERQAPARGVILPGSERILIVDDDDALRSMSARVLAQAGYDVVEARSGTDAVDLVRRQGLVVDLLVTDIVMPGLGGPALAQALIAENRLTRVLYVSGYADQPVLREQIARGAVHFLAKPFAPPELAARVRQALDS